MLPLPSVVNTDVLAEKLKDVESRYQESPKGINFAGAASAGMETADAMTSRFAKMDERQRAAQFQKVLDTGWEGYEAAVAASPFKDDPSLKALKTGDAKIDASVLPTKWKEFADKLAGKKSTDILASGGTAAAAAAALGDAKTAVEIAAKGEERTATSLEKQKDRTADTERDKANRESREKIAREDNAARVALEGLKETIKSANTTVPMKAQAEKDLKTIRSLNEQMKKLSTEGLGGATNAKLYDDLAVQRRAALSRVADAGTKGVVVEDNKKGVYNPATGKIDYPE